MGRVAYRAVLWGWCVALLVAAAGCVGGGSPSNPPAVPPDRAGFSDPGWVVWESDADRARDLDNQAATGAKWVRLAVDFNAVQFYGRASWDWSLEDRAMGAALSRGFRVLAMPSYTPPWARQASCSSSMYCPPANPNDFATFVRAAAARYAPYGVHAWEIWNEPNWAPWWIGAPDAPGYVALLKPTYGALHQVDPGVTVVSGGLAPHGNLRTQPNDPISPVNYLKAMYAAGAHGYFDAFGIHPYPPLPYGPNYGSPDWNTFLQTSKLHDVMTWFGDGNKKIWGTEYGAPTGSSDSKAVTPDQQAQYIDEGLRSWTAKDYTGPLLIHTVRDTTPGAPDDWGAYMGLYTIDYKPKPAVATLTNLLH